MKQDAFNAFVVGGRVGQFSCVCWVTQEDWSYKATKGREILMSHIYNRSSRGLPLIAN